MRVLITGAAGFVGPHVAEALRRMFGRDVAIIATSKSSSYQPYLEEVETLDITDRKAVESAIARYAPTHVVHLAGIAVPSIAADSPDATWCVHVRGTLNIARAIMHSAPACWMLNIGSGLVYGDSARLGLPLDESALLAPVEDYGVTKAAADLAIGALARRGLRCVRLRPFNHAGAGQSEAFVLSALAMQIARAEAGLAEAKIRVGDLDAERDFLDVRDVAAAYALCVRKAETIVPGTVLNIASGKSYSIKDMLERLLSLSRTKIEIEQDPARMRPSDLPCIVGNAERARQLLGWKPEYTIGETLEDVLADCRTRVALEQR